jgi:PKD repeat protein
VEDRYDDNTITWVEQVNDPGPNLSVDKHTNWHWTWEGQLEFELRIRNLGTERLDNFWITDTYPISTGFYGNWWVNHGPWITWTQDAENHLFAMWVDELNPGDTASVGFQLDVDPEIIGVEGLAFTNTLEAPIANDTNPADNTDTLIAYSGPDVFVNKWLSGGDLRAGEIVTFTVEFGNQNFWPWDGDKEYGSHITDTLPEAMTFITATAPWNPEEYWAPESMDGNEIAWGWGTMWNNSIWSFDIVAQIADDVVGGDVLTNRIEAFGDSPDDIEPNWENNVYEMVMTIEAAPQASFTTNSPVRFGEEIVFTNTSIPGYPAPAYSWDFGDGSTSSAENPTHLYAAAGTYTVTLTVTNEIGSSTFSQEVEVEQPLIHLPLIFKNN